MNKKIIKKLVPDFILKPLLFVYGINLRLYHRLNSKSYRIIQHPEQEFKVVYKIKDETWEDTCYPECYGHSKEMHLSVYCPAEYIFKENNAFVCTDSDTIITPRGVYWSKFNNEEFVTWAKPTDYNVLGYDREYIRVFKRKNRIFVNGKVLSLLGNCSRLLS